MFFWVYYVVLFISAWLFSTIGTGMLVRLLPSADVMDVPNERSNHAAPIPRGAGLAVMGSALAMMLVAGMHAPVVWGAIALMVVSFMDDLNGVRPQVRLLVQIAAVAWAVSAIEKPVFQGLLPIFADKMLAAVLWIWFLNLFNFMDGIDGITSVQSVSLAIGFTALWASVDNLPGSVVVDAGILAAAILGFAWWNWHPARIFLGDVGSVPLGFVFGFLLLLTAASGYWQAALILPAYYLSDAGFTLIRRLLKRERVWESHTQHAYQKAARNGRPHNAIVTDLAGLNLILVVLAVASAVYPQWGWALLGAAYLLALGWMHHFSSTLKHPFHAK